MPEYITDTGPLVGWINRRDQWHSWAVSTLESLEPPLMTCEAVIAEAIWLLRSSPEAVGQLYSLVEVGALRIIELLPEHMSAIRSLTVKYEQMDFCDAAAVRLSEMFPKAIVITTDIGHFTVYRRFRHKSLPLLCPQS